VKPLISYAAREHRVAGCGPSAGRDTREETVVKALPQLPENLSEVSADDLDRYEGDILDVAGPLQKKANDDPDAVTDDEVELLEQAASMLQQVRDAKTGQEAAAAERAERVRSAASALGGDDADEDEANKGGAGTTTEDGEPADPELVGVQASRAGVRGIRPRIGQLRKAKVDVPAAPRGAIVAAAGVPGYVAGQKLDDMSAVGSVLEANLASYPRVARPGPRQRNSAIIFQRPPADQQAIVADGRDQDKVLKAVRYAANERRLPGGSLLNAVTADVSAGWCAPSETIYDLCNVGGDVYGLWDAPTIQVARGGIRFAQGPDFSAIYAATNDFHFTEAQIKVGELNAGTPTGNPLQKPCISIPCPSFQEVRLDVDGMCITGDILQERGYPEAVTQFTEGLMAAHAHKINARKLAQIAGTDPVTGSGAVIDLTTGTVSDTGTTGLLAQLEIAAIDVRARYRISDGTSLEGVFPTWIKAVIRADISRRNGGQSLSDQMSVTDQQIVGWFTERGIAPQFVVDWQDNYATPGTTLPGQPQATALKTLPETVNFLLYLAGSWTVGQSDVITLDTIYDSTLLKINQYTALFTEEAFVVFKRCPESRQYKATLKPYGLTGAQVTFTG
jgi:hypothetical protein